MKKTFIALLLIVALLIGQSIAFAERPARYGMWNRYYSVDEFGLPTDEICIANYRKITGTFSNSATTNSPLEAVILMGVNPYLVNIRLFEYQKSPVKNSSSKEIYYRIAMLDTYKIKHEYTGTMLSGGDAIILNCDDSEDIIGFLSREGTVIFSITRSDRPTTKYLFQIDDTTGLINALLPEDMGREYGDGLLAVKKNGYWGYVDTEGVVSIPYQWGEWAGTFHEGLARVKENFIHGYGFIDTSGEIVIPCEWDNADDFSDGLAAVQKDGKWGYIDKQGNLVIPCEIDYGNVRYEFNGGYLPFEENEKTGFMDSHGNIAIPATFDDFMLSGFQDGFAAVKKDGKWMFVDETGANVFGSEWDDVKSFSEGLAGVCKDGEWGYIDTSGNLVIPYCYDYCQKFSEGLAMVGKTGNTAIIDSTGDIRYVGQWDYALWFSEGFAAVEIDDKWGFINTEYELVIPCEWQICGDFHDGYAFVFRNSKERFVDTNGNVMIP